jgi:hypothetical protein
MEDPKNTSKKMEYEDKERKKGEGQEMENPKKKGGRKQREIRRKVLQARTYRIKF